MRNNLLMNISLTPEQEDAADRLVKAGLFASKDDAVARSHDWLREEAEKFEAIRARLEASAEASARGESREIVTEDIMRPVRERLEEDSVTNPPA